MKHLFIIGVFFLVGCTNYDYRIDKMPSRTLSYKQLPERVQKSLVDFSCHLIEEKMECCCVMIMIVINIRG